MSSALAIASVTAVLKNLLDNGMIDDHVVGTVGNVTVTARAPDLITLDASTPSQLNLFLYQVTPNQGWRNAGMPARNADGDRLTNPPLALDLYYLLTAYTAQDLHAEILLGYGMQVLHEMPMLPRQGIRGALGVSGILAAVGQLPANLQALAASELAEQVEAIKITPTVMNSEEMSKLWAAFQSRYRPSAAYHVSVVLIQARKSTRAALPVRKPKFYVVPFREPFIERVLAQEAAGGPARADLPVLPKHRLVLRGRQLKGERTLVRIAGSILAPAPEDIEDTEISFKLPSGLSAGIQSVQVVHERLMGEPPLPHRGVASNLAVFVLHPEIVSVNLDSPPVGVHLTIDPPVESKQEVVLLLNEKPAALSPPVELPPLRAYSFVGPSRPQGSPPGPTSQIDIPIAGVNPGIYLARVRVDGAESLLSVDPSGSGYYASPVVNVP
jgi:hypothetical protein